MYLEIFLADFAGFRGNTWISRVRDRAKYQKPWKEDYCSQSNKRYLYLTDGWPLEWSHWGGSAERYMWFTWYCWFRRPGLGRCTTCLWISCKLITYKHNKLTANCLWTSHYSDYLQGSNLTFELNSQMASTCSGFTSHKRVSTSLGTSVQHKIK